MEMTSAHIIDLMPRLRARDVHELTGLMREATLVDFAARRAQAPGLAWTLMVDGVPMWCGGALEGVVAGTGALWLLGAVGCELYVKHLLRVWRLMLVHGGFRRLECKCYADNEAANRFALRAGFSLEGTLRGYTVRGEDVNQYGMVLGGDDGR